MTVELFDTHCHFTAGADSAAILERARAAGVSRVMAVGGSRELNECALAAKTGYLALGYDRDQTAAGRPALDFSKVSAVGEIGLDYFYDPDGRKAQLKLFEEQLAAAARAGKPVVIHTRDADDDTLGALRAIPSRGIIHCFTGPVGFCRQLLDLGFMISYSGIVTFRKADNVRESALFVPDDRLLIETDSPFLAPVPERGKENEPAFLVHTARFLAGLRKTSFEELAALTTTNAMGMLCDCSCSSP